MDTRVFQSLLWLNADDVRQDEVVPAFLADLQLDDIIAAACAGAGASQERVRGYFMRPARDEQTIAYRQAVMAELEKPALAAPLRAFVAGLQRMRIWEQAARRTDVPPVQAARWFLQAALTYGDCLRTLDATLRTSVLTSAGLMGWQAWLGQYLADPAYLAFENAANRLDADFRAACFNVRLNGNTVEMAACADEADYGAQVVSTFERLRDDAPEAMPAAREDAPVDLNAVEQEILARTAALHPAVFERLLAFRGDHPDFAHEVVCGFEADLGFYLAWQDYLAPMRAAGLPFCYPQVSATDQRVVLREGFDLALATRLVAEGQGVVCNDVELLRGERLLVITGPNQAGKTGIARAIGQAHYLAALGCAVPGRSARVFLCDRIFTHFEREEDLAHQQSKLEDDLVRMHAILAEATPRSLLVLNETFASTTLHDATALGRCVMAELSRRGLLAVFVTFIDELSGFDAHTVSLVGLMRSEEGGGRTYRFQRRKADGRAYALAIAAQYGLSYAQIKERLSA